MSKKDDIKEAFTDLIISDGIRNLNMNDVFKKANVGSGTFYNYYKSKEELIADIFREYTIDALDSTKVEIPNGVKIDDVKPYIMSYLDKVIGMMTTKNKRMQVLSILAPELRGKAPARRPGDDFNKSQEITEDRLSWLRDLLIKGQDLGQIVNLNPSLLREMILGSVVRILIPVLIANLDGKKTKPVTKEQLELVKQCIWNMISTQN